ncbi:hypothetical protein [Okeania sp. SIO1I7]|uniref:hypothetical protein n=1 Tax=Okeania sp. SIO1I7 TaxID=2607772 RepID=UPI0013F85CA2|nr:hypothetical protein [Okeania sp. SIO1I7]NET29947.1 hypothetical protein [Okeania sp. SIO1I7]
MGGWGDGEMGGWGGGGMGGWEPTPDPSGGGEFGEMGRWGDGEMGRWGPTPSPSQEGNIEKYLVMVEYGTFFYTELNGFDINYGNNIEKHLYSAFQIDELHRHNKNLVGTLHATSLLWSTDMKTAVLSQLNIFPVNHQ